MDAVDHEAAAGLRDAIELSEEQWLVIGDHLRLSRRELDIARHVYSDLKETAIAQSLGISAHTVHTHLERLYRKLDVTTRVELVLRVLSSYMLLIREGRTGFDPICQRHGDGSCPFSE